MAYCDMCGDREAVFPPERIRVFIPGLGVSPTVRLLSNACAACTEKEFLECFGDIPSGLLVRVGESASVNWETYVEFRRHAYRDDGYIYDRANMLLLMLGVFTHERNGNWEIRSELASLNPESVIGTLYFTSCVYAIAFAREALFGAEYSWFIFKYGDLITREEIFATQKPVLA